MEELTLPRILAASEVPLAATRLLEDIAAFRGKQEMFANQSPERLAVLRESAIIESAVSSTRMEQVHVDAARIGTVLFGTQVTRDRDEEEVRGYRRALDWIHADHAEIELSPDTLCRLHAFVRAGSGDAGTWKERAAADMLGELCSLATSAMRDRIVPLPVLLAVSNLDLLCIHPFRDGNGRVSRLLLLLQMYHAGLDVGRYVGAERFIEESKDRYYATLHSTSMGWHDGTNDPWEYIDYLLFTIRAAYRAFEQRWNDSIEPRGAKTSRVLAAIADGPDSFTSAQLQHACPGISRELIRRVLRASPDVVAVGRGPGALWQKQ